MGAGKVFIGNANADSGVGRGYVDAYEIAPGKHLWRFYTIPGDPAKGFENAAMARASKTWGKDYWKHSGGGSAWEGITYDPVTNLVYIGTDGPSPYDPATRDKGTGDELYTNAIVAVNADTGEAGAHSWRPMSFDPGTHWIYIPVVEDPMVYSYAPKNHYRRGTSSEYERILDDEAASAEQRGTARVPVHHMDFLEAYDPVAQSVVWRRPVSSGPDQGGGVLATAGNVVIQGDNTGFLHIYASDTGTPLAHINVGTGMMAAPISYAIDGEQYIAVMAGLGGAANWSFPKDSAAYRYGNAGRIVAFKLGGGRVPLPPHIDHNDPVPIPPAVKSTPAMIEHGKGLFEESGCNWCHANSGPGLVPDLFAMSPQTHSLFKQIVLGGLLEQAGMASFADRLTESDVEALQAYLVDGARRRLAERPERRPAIRP